MKSQRLQIAAKAALLAVALALPAASGSADPIVLRANAVPGSDTVVRPLLPPDTITIDSNKDASSEGSTAEAATKPEPRNLPSAASRKGIGVELSHQSGVDTVSLKTSLAEPIFSIQQISNPPRLVVDVEAQIAGGNRTVPTKDLDFVSAIRVGSHPTKSRIVLDLRKAEGFSHVASVVDGAIVVTMRASQPAPAAAPDVGGFVSSRIEEAIADATAERGFTQDDGESAIDLNADKGLQVAEAEPSAAKVELASMQSSAGVKGIKVMQVGLSQSRSGSQEVQIGYLGKPDYQLQRTAPSEYVLTLRKAVLDKSVDRKPIIAESRDASIRSVRMTAEGSNVLVRLFSQPSVYLTAREERGKIVIAETQDLTQVVKDIRAQLAPPSAAKGEGRATDAAEVQSPTIPTLPVAAKSEQSAGNEEKTADPKAAPVQPKKPVASRAKGKTTVTEISDADIDALLGDKAKYGGKLISLDLQETDIDNALRIIAEVSNLNIVASEDVKGKVTLRLLDVPWDQALDVILKTNGLDKVVEGSVMRIAPVDKLKVERENLKEAKDAEEDLEPLAVKYMRVSYAKAAEIKSIVETVLSERGSVAYDERSNQLIVKDVRTGLKNVVELVSKIDLRTPQVLLETQIVESSRNLTRELGSQLGFQYIQSPSTGNGTGSNFPSAISFGGSVDPSTGNLGSSFPVAIDPTLGGSAISMLFDSADGTKSLELRLSQLEQEGRIRIISRPAVATTNNKAAEIKSVEKFRVRLPNGGLSVATGAGASASGTSNTATEVIEAGITLNVTPQASPDYYILLDIKARSSTFGSNYRVGDIPNEFERSASSTVLVSSGQTFALGGIYKVTESDTVSGVPFFKDIPVIGTFFRRSSTNDSDEELLFFITPRIVEGSFDNASMKSIS